MSNLSEIKRLQSNATETLLGLVDYVNNASDAHLTRATLWHLTEEAEGAFNEFLEAAKLLRPSFEYTKTTSEMAQAWMAEALKNKQEKCA